LLLLSHPRARMSIHRMSTAYPFWMNVHDKHILSTSSPFFIEELRPFYGE
jgi:hypothetical protein